MTKKKKGRIDAVIPHLKVVNGKITSDNAIIRRALRRQQKIIAGLPKKKGGKKTVTKKKRRPQKRKPITSTWTRRRRKIKGHYKYVWVRKINGKIQTRLGGHKLEKN